MRVFSDKNTETPLRALQNLLLVSSFPNKGDRSPPRDCKPRDLGRFMRGREISTGLSRLA